MAVNANKRCSSCNVESAVAHLPGKICVGNEECIAWYSLEHHLLFCKERIKAFKLFVPKIDLNLLSSFGDLFQLDEKYSVILSSPAAAEFVNLPKITIMPNISNNNDCCGTVVVNDTLNITQANNENVRKLLDSMASKTIICVPRKIEIKKSHLSLENVLCLLSPYTKEFNFEDSACTPTLNFIDVIKKAPNIESFRSYDWETNIQIDKTWPDDLLKYKKGKNFRYLSFKFGVIEEFNIEKFIEFVRTKCTDTVFIKLSYAQQLDNNDETMWGKMNKIAEKLHRYLNNRDSFDETLPYLWIGFDGVDGYECISLANCMKRRVMPSRGATKRRYNEK